MLCPYWTYVRPQRTMRQLIVIVSARSVLPGQNLAWSKGLMEDVMFDPSIPCSHSAALPKHPPAKVVTYCTDMVEGVQWLLLKAPKNTEDPFQVNVGYHIIHIIFNFWTAHLIWMSSSPYFLRVPITYARHCRPYTTTHKLITNASSGLDIGTRSDF